MESHCAEILDGDDDALKDSVVICVIVCFRVCAPWVGGRITGSSPEEEEIGTLMEKFGPPRSQDQGQEPNWPRH